MMRLHGLCQSGNTYKVALALQAMGLRWEPVFVDFMNGVTRGADWRAEFNAMGEIPLLEDGQRRLTQSGVILSYLARQTGRYCGADEDEAIEVLRWLFFDNHKFTSYFATWRFLKAFAAEPPDPKVAAFLRPRIDNAFGIVERHLADRDYLVGARPTIADLSLCGYLYFPPDESGIDVAAAYPAIGRWLDRLRALPGFAGPYDLLPGERIAPRW